VAVAKRAIPKASRRLVIDCNLCMSGRAEREQQDQRACRAGGAPTRFASRAAAQRHDQGGAANAIQSSPARPECGDRVQPLAAPPSCWYLSKNPRVGWGIAVACGESALMPPL